LRAALAQVCERDAATIEVMNADAIEKGRLPDTPQMRSSIAVKANFVRAFCDAPGERWSFEEALNSDPGSDVAMASRLLALPSEKRADSSQQALDILNMSSNPDAIVEAARFLAGGENVHWDLGAREVPLGLRDELPGMQILAARMVACDLSGGCGPNGVYVWMECMRYSLCRPGLSMDELWRETYSPIEYRLAMGLANQLRGNRQTFGGKG
jgi:hypothetical protein